MSSACYARSRGGFGFLSQRFHRLFATRPVRSETNKQFGGHVRCGGSEEHSRGFHPGGKTHSQEWLCHVPSTSCWAKVFGVPLGLACRKFRLSRTSGLIVPAYARCGRGEEHSGGFHLGGKGAQPGMAVPRSGVGGWGPGMGLAGFDEREDGHEEG